MAIGAGLWRSSERTDYNTFKDLLPLVVALPAAWFGFCLQRRASYLQQVRIVWSLMVDAVQTAIQYTHRSTPSEGDLGDAHLRLSRAIDEVRAVYRNLGEGPGKRGRYPFESLKAIPRLLNDLGYGAPLKPDEAKRVRETIVELWQQLQPGFLHEFERESPAKPDALPG
jgi:hypothetical protein